MWSNNLLTCMQHATFIEVFLYCRIGEVLFNFLGIPIGANLRLSSMCYLVIKKLRDRLSIWRSRQLSMDGRITIINSALASLPLYYFSFFKAPKKVIKEMVQIQRNFLWGGSDEVRKMAWVRWNKICLPKEFGGLGIRNMEIFNISLLGKWKWRLLSDNESIWFVLMKKLYSVGSLLNCSQYSVWWEDLKSLDECIPFAQS